MKTPLRSRPLLGRTLGRERPRGGAKIGSCRETPLPESVGATLEAPIPHSTEQTRGAEPRTDARRAPVLRKPANPRTGASAFPTTAADGRSLSARRPRQPRPSRGRPARVICPTEGGAAPAIRNDRDRGPGRVGPPARNPASGSRPPPNSGAPGLGGFRRPPRRPTESTPVTGASDAFTCMSMMERVEKRSNRNRETNRTILCITRFVLHNRCTDYPQVYAH